MDTIKLGARLTLTPGLRWVFQGVPQETRGRFSNFLPLVGLAPANQLPNGQIYQNVWTNFEPRLGLGYVLLPSPRHLRFLALLSQVVNGLGILQKIFPDWINRFLKLAFPIGY